MQKTQVFLRKGRKAARKDADWRAATAAVAGLWKDRTDFEDLSRIIRSAAKQRFASLYRRT